MIDWVCSTCWFRWSFLKFILMYLYGDNINVRFQWSSSLSNIDALVELLCFGRFSVHLIIVFDVFLFVFHSPSHAVFTINMVNNQKWDVALTGDLGTTYDRCEDFVCAKLHLVDLAGSEWAKRIGADGLRFKEGTCPFCLQSPQLCNVKFWLCSSNLLYLQVLILIRVY